MTYEEEVKELRRAFGSLFTKLLPRALNQVLEVGCGDGVFTRFLADDNADNVTAVDIDADAIKKAEEKNTSKNVVFKRISDEKMGKEFFPFIAKGSLDAVFFYRSLHFVANAASMLDEVNQLLRPGGALVIIHKDQIRLNYRPDRDLAFLLDGSYRNFCSEVFSEQLASYWTPTTSENFARYCDPDRAEHGLPCAGGLTQLSVSVKAEMNVIDLKKELLRTSVARALLREPGGEEKFEHAYHSFLEHVCDLLDFPLEEIYFSDQFTIEKTSNFYVQINYK